MLLSLGRDTSGVRCGSQGVSVKAYLDFFCNHWHITRRMKDLGKLLSGLLVYPGVSLGNRASRVVISSRSSYNILRVWAEDNRNYSYDGYEKDDVKGFAIAVRI